jgi:hypothetical protein
MFVSRAQLARKADLTAICEPTVVTMWDQHLTTLRACTAWYGDSFALLITIYRGNSGCISGSDRGK